jgi:phasin family protein
LFSRLHQTFMKERVMTTEKTRAAAKALPAPDVIETAKDQFAKATESQFKVADEAAAFGKSNVEAFIQAGSIFFQGFEELTRSFVGLTQTQVEASMSAAKAMIGAKTLTELTELQNSYGKSVFDHVVSDATHISELAIKIANETMEPISARLTAAMEHIGKPPFATA